MLIYNIIQTRYKTKVEQQKAESERLQALAKVIIIHNVMVFLTHQKYVLLYIIVHV